MKIVQFWGMRRSGNHAIIEWLIRNFSDEPVSNIDNWDVRKYGDLLFLNNYEDQKSHYYKYIDEHKPKILFVSYEDKPLNFSMGLCGDTTNIVICRSLENVVASRYKKGKDHFWREVMPLDSSFFEMWAEHACYDSLMCYDKWLVDKEYRDGLCQKLGVCNKDITDVVSRHGDGSSFVGLDLDTTHNLLNRDQMVELPENLLTMISRVKHNLSDNFAFCINLNTQEHKYNYVLDELRKINILPHRYVAQKNSALEKSKDITKTHIALLRHCSTLPYDYFIVFEDDILVIDETLDINAVVASAPPDWSVIYLGGMNHVYQPVYVNDKFYKCTFSLNMHAYVIRKSFILTFLDCLSNSDKICDVVAATMQSSGNGCWYGLQNDAIIQDGIWSYTTITTTYNSFKKLHQYASEKTIMSITTLTEHKNFNKKRIIAFSLFGNQPHYYNGAIENCKLALTLYAGWTCRFYIADDVSSSFVSHLKTFNNVEVVHMGASKELEGMCWRFLAVDDLDAEYTIIRDCDSRLSVREKAAVDEWIASGKSLHVMFDHKAHKNPMMAGMWGAKNSTTFNMAEKLKSFTDEFCDFSYGSDERFLANYIWPHSKDDVVTHSFKDNGWFAASRNPDAFIGKQYMLGK